MAILYKNLDGKPVSRAWHRVLTRARENGVRFSVTSGHRTMAEQWRLYRLWKAGLGNLAAYPSPTAPHIRTGRADHAIDFGPDPASVQRLIAYLNERGLNARLTVPGEWWHVEVHEAKLRSLAKRILAKPRRLRPWRKVPTDISTHGIQIIEHFEGHTPYAYNDPVGFCTAGPGILLHKSICRREDYAMYGSRSNPKITPSEYRSMFRKNARPRVAELKRLLGPALKRTKQHEFDALLSLGWNIGMGALATSTALRQHKAGNHRAAADALLLWNKASGKVFQGLVRRRKAERHLYLTGQIKVNF